MAGHTHDHGEHTHSHDHDHSHGGDTYFIDQLCMVGLSGAFGVICLCLWLWQTQMLTLMLGPQFHFYVLLSGIALTVLAVARAAILWQQSRDPKFVAGHDHHHHDHAHDHKHDHQHAHAIKEATPTAVQSLPMTTAASTCGHEHAPGETCEHGHEHHHHEHAPGEKCDHEHHHAHEHNIGHAHAAPDHDEADHDHGWAPWRYVVVLLPIILFLLGVPNKPPALEAKDKSVMSSPELDNYLRVLTLTTDTLGQLVYVGAVYNLPDDVAEAIPVDFKTLESMATDAERPKWDKKVVRVIGQYSPVAGSNQVFMLVRLKISCCANDAVQLDVPMASREPITGISRDEWVKVKGRVEFRRRGNSYVTVLMISKASNVEKSPPDPNPYIQ
jgi:hypothetical protein